MKELTVKELYTLDETIAKDIFEGVTYPWEVLPKISRFIVELGNTLSEEEYEKQGENIWIAKTAKVAKSASITGPAIIAAGFETLSPFPPGVYAHSVKRFTSPRRKFSTT